MPSYLDRIGRGRPAPRVPQQEEAESEFGWFDTAITTGLRVVPSIFGTLGGGALGALAGAPAAGVGALPAGAIGAAAGGAAGGGFGEWLAQEYEKSRGVRKEIDPWGVGIEAGLGAVPLGKSATLGRAALKGAGMGLAGTTAHSIAEEGELPDVGTAGLSALLGGGFGAGGEAIARRLGGKVPAAAGAAEKTADDAVDFVPDHGRFNRFAEHYMPPDDYAWRDQAGGPPPRPSHLPPEVDWRKSATPEQPPRLDEPDVEFEADAGPMRPRSADVDEYNAYLRRMREIDDAMARGRGQADEAVDFVPDHPEQLVDELDDSVDFVPDNPEDLAPGPRYLPWNDPRRPRPEGGRQARPRQMPEDDVEFVPYHDDSTVDFVPDEAAGRGPWPPDAEGYAAREALERNAADPNLPNLQARDAAERAAREYGEVQQLLREQPDAPDVRALAKQFGIEIPRTAADEAAEVAAREGGLAREAVERYADDPNLPAMQHQDAIERAVRERSEVAQLLKEEPDAPDVRALAKLFGLIDDEAVPVAKPKRAPRGKKKKS